MASLVMSASAKSSTETPFAKLDESLKVLADNRERFARLSPERKADLLESCLPLLLEVAPRWVEAGCRAKGFDADTPLAGEEWLAGPVTTIRNVRLLVDALRAIGRSGVPPFGRGIARRDDGRLEVKVFPTGALDAISFAGITGTQLYPAGVTEQDARDRQASFYKQSSPDGGVALILGAGNVSSIPPMDALYKGFVEGFTVLIKMNPVNEYIGPFIEEGFRPLFEQGFWRVCYGGAEVGTYLVGHEAIEDVHITGSDRTHDLIVWGPPAEQARRKAANDPVLKKRITSELGNVTPVIIIPGPYTDAEHAALADNVVAMVQNNGSFNCNAAKMLVTAKGWSGRERLLADVQHRLERLPLRRAYYPGARDRYDKLTGGRDRVWFSACERDDGLKWALIADLDPARADEPLFVTEPFCGILSEVALDDTDPAAFLDKAVSFANDRLWGTLSLTVVVPPALERSAAVQTALDRAIVDLRYGSVAINQWSALAYAFVSTAWGGHPSATLANVQSGIGWVHNTYMLEGFDKTVVRAPLVIKPKPAWFHGHRTVHKLGPKLAALEAKGGWWRLPSIVATALGG